MKENPQIDPDGKAAASTVAHLGGISLDDHSGPAKGNVNPIQTEEPFAEKARENMKQGASQPDFHLYKDLAGSNPAEKALSRGGSNPGMIDSLGSFQSPTVSAISPGCPASESKPPESCPYLQKNANGVYLCVTDSARVVMQKGCWANGFQPCFKDFQTCMEWKRIAG